MNVLLLTDFSSGARHAHKYALNLFAETNVNYFLLHSDFNYNSAAHSIGENKQRLEDEAHIYKNWDLSDGSQLTCIKTSKKLIDAIRHLMKTHTIDLVVMGASGNSNQLNNQLGKNTTSTATKIKCPVLIVFQGSVIKNPLNIAFPVDYTDKLQVSCLQKLRTLPTSHKFIIEVLEINTKNTERALSKKSKKILQKGLEKLNITYKENKEFNINKLETSNKKEFDLISFAAKNLSVYNTVFNQLKSFNKVLEKQPPLYILHD